MSNIQAYTQDHSGNQNSPALQRPYFPVKVPVESHDQGLISRQSTLSPLEKKDLLWTPQRSDTASTADLLSYSKGTSDSSNIDGLTKFSSPQRVINNFSDEDFDEFAETASPRFGRKSISQKVTTSHLPKKSMGDIISRLEIRTLNDKPLLSKHNSTTEDKSMLSQRFYQRSHTDFPVCQEFHTGTFTEINEKSKFMAFNSILPIGSQSFIHDENFGQRSSRMYLERNCRRVKVILTDFDVLENILRYCDFKDVLHLSKLLFEFRNNKLYQKIFTKRLHELFNQGLDRKDQIFYWNSILNFRSLKNDHPFAFSQHFAKKCAYLSDITKDLDRTLPDYEKFSTEEGKASLLSVLIAVSNTIKDVGYIQGLNSIAGVFLFHLKEEESFWIILYFMEKLNFKELLKEDFNRVHILDFQLQVYLDNYIPAVAEHFRKNQMNVSYFTTPWFLTLFSYHLKISNVLKVWNLLFTRGISYLVQLALSIFHKYENEILTMDTDEVGCFLKNELQNLSEQETSLFSTALTFKVSNRLLAGLEDHYEKGNYYLKLIEDETGKKQWAVCQSFKEGSPRKGERRMRSKTDFSIKESQEKRKDIFQSFLNKFTVELPDTLKNMFKKKEENKRERNMAPSTLRSLTERDEGVSSFETRKFNPEKFVAYTLGDYEPSLNIIKPQPVAEARRKSRTYNDLTRSNSLFQSVQTGYTNDNIQTNKAIANHGKMDDRSHRRLYTMASLQVQQGDSNYNSSSNTLNSIDNYDPCPKTDRGDYFAHRSSFAGPQKEAFMTFETKSYTSLAIQQKTRNLL